MEQIARDMPIQTVTFYKVIVLSIGLCESEIMNERHFADYVSAAAYKAAVTKNGLVAVIVEV